jgi:hypothetical protein
LSEFSTQSSVDIARRLEIRGDDSRSWIALIIPAQDPQRALSNLEAHLSSLLQRPTRIFNLQDEPFDKLSQRLHEPDDDIAILVAFADIGLERWSSLDLIRSALERKGPIVLWLSSDCVPAIVEHAPNIRSFIGASLFCAGPDGGLMTDEDRQKRLQELGEFYNLTNEEIIHRAESNALPSEPHFVEWLVLLGRGDLV